MRGNSEHRKYKNSFLNWIEFRLPIISYFEKEYGDYPMPKNCNYFWSFGALATITLVVMIVSGIFLVFIQTKFSLIPIPSDIYFVDTLPMVLMPRDLFIIVFLSFIFIIAASYTSGRKLAHSNIKDALQWAK